MIAKTNGIAPAVLTKFFHLHHNVYRLTDRQSRGDNDVGYARYEHVFSTAKQHRD